MTSIEKILDGVEMRSTGYQDDERYWNLDLNFQREYEEPVIGRVMENGSGHVLMVDSVPVGDHIDYAGLKPGKDHLVKHQLDDMSREKELYATVCAALEVDDDRPPNTASPAAVALD